jgi:hypothetical protein
MIRINRFGQVLLVGLFVGFFSSNSNAAEPRIVPLRTQAAFSAQNAQNLWSVPIKSPDGRTIYVLSLEPSNDNHHHPVLVSLVLRRTGDKPDSPNRLDPTGNWHGLQAYDFAGRDLKQGAQKSAFGKERTVTLKKLGLVLHIGVSKAVVSQVSPQFYQVDALDLQIAVDNLNP